ncbi:MAG: rhomboid family intramembrane serine protease [Deltaproteobacteria bacterium]|nr:rhomboid family intramembrane serine protease [Deltaproteobacteria bacterium]
METRYDQISPVPPLTKVTKSLIIICAVVYVFDFVLYHLGFQVGGLHLNQIFGLVPLLVKEKLWLWQFVTYIFMHGHPFHILLNMLILWYFGAELELRIGQGGFLKYFFLCGIGAGVFNFAVNVLFSDPSRLSHPIIGASGAIFGILAAYGIFFGNRYFLVFFLFPMKAKYFVLLIAALELMMGVKENVQDNVAHFAHVGGMFVGALYIYLKYMRPRGTKGAGKKDYEREKLRRQFTLIVNQSNSGEPEDKGPYWN